MANQVIQIEVIGAGCPSCKKLFDLVKQVVSGMNISQQVEYSTDIQKIVRMGLMQSPVLAVNGRPALVGFTPDIEKIKKAIQDNL